MLRALCFGIDLSSKSQTLTAGELSFDVAAIWSLVFCSSSRSIRRHDVEELRRSDHTAAFNDTLCLDDWVLSCID